MQKLNHELEIYINDKIHSLKKIERWSYYTNMVIRFGVLFLNLIIIILAAWVISIQVKWYQTELKPLGAAFSLSAFLEAAGLTVVLASFIVLTFLINLILSFYSAFMKYVDYKQALREIEHITIKLEEDQSNYSIVKFDQDLEHIKTTYLTKKKVSKREILMKFIMGGK